MTTTFDYRTGRAEGFLPFLLGSTSPTVFVDKYWGQKPLFVKGEASRFTELFSRASLNELQHAARGSLLHDKDSEPTHGCTIIRVDPSGVVTEIESEDFDCASYDATIQIKNFHRVNRGLSELCASLKSELTFAGSVTCELMLAIPGSRIPNHLDNESVFSIQLEGTRSWRISSRPVIQWPHRTLQMDDNGMVQDGDGEPWEYEVERLRSEQFIDFLLEPGDLLFHPSGVWHELVSVTAGPMGQSVSISIVFQNEMLSKVFNDLVTDGFASNPLWRNFPVVPRGESPDTIPPQIREFFYNRSYELRVMANAIDPNGLELHRHWKRLVAQYERCDSTAKLAESSTDAVLPSDQLVVSTNQPVAFVSGKDPKGKELLYVYHGSTEVCLDKPELISFAQELMRRKVFVAAAAVDWVTPKLSWEQTKTLLEELLAVGLLQRTRP